MDREKSITEPEWNLDDSIIFDEETEIIFEHKKPWQNPEEE